MGQNATKSVPNFEINTRKTIGTGTFGTTFEAKDRDGNPRAAKRVEHTDTQRLTRITHELKKIKLLKHENIVKTLDIQVRKKSLWIFTEYCRHGDLNTYLHVHSKTALPLRSKMQLMQDIVNGMNYLHKKNIIHGDIKPASILVKGIPKNDISTSSKKVVAKISLGGISRCSKEKFPEANPSTFTFKPPEFFLKEECVVSSDVYSVGLIFLAMIQCHDPLKPRIETQQMGTDSEKNIGDVIAQRIRCNVQPLDVLKGETEGGLVINSRLRLTRRRVVGNVRLPAQLELLDDVVQSVGGQVDFALEEDRIQLSETITAQEREPPRATPNAHQEMRRLIHAMTRASPGDRITAERLVQEIDSLIPKDLVMQHTSKHLTGLVFWKWTRFTVMESGPVVWGKTAEDGLPMLHFYRGSAGFWKKLDSQSAFCDHYEDTQISAVKVRNADLLAVSCWKCSMIRLYNPETKKTTVALHNDRYSPSVMSIGKNSDMYFIDKRCLFVQLDCSTENFRVKREVVDNSGLYWFFDICYIPNHELIVRSTHSSASVKALSAKTGEGVWELKGEVRNEECHCHGAVYSSELDALLVADGYRTRVLVVNAADGTLRQVVPFNVEMGTIAEMCLHKNFLVILHMVVGEMKISYFALETNKSKQLVPVR